MSLSLVANPGYCTDSREQIGQHLSSALRARERRLTGSQLLPWRAEQRVVSPRDSPTTQVVPARNTPAGPSFRLRRSAWVSKERSLRDVAGKKVEALCLDKDQLLTCHFSKDPETDARLSVNLLIKFEEPKLLLQRAELR